MALTSHHAPGSGPRRFKPYPEYKDSGVEWIGSIPTHWGIEPLFTVARERKQRNAGNQVENVLSLSYGKIVRRDIATNFGLLPESFDTYQLVEPGNIVLRLTDLQNDKRSLRVGLVEELGIITSAYVGLDLYRRLTPSYGFYLLHAYDVTKVFYAFGAGVRQTMKFDDLKWMPVLVPEADEQRVIVAFLDRETAEIDALVAKKERLIELLHEKRTAVITRAVTKSLAPNVPMKDSGVEWLGEIPAHWEVTRVKSLSQFVTSGSRGWAEHYSDHGPLFLRIGNLRSGAIDLDLSDVQHVQPPEGAEGQRTRVRGGDVLISITALVGAVGVAPDGIPEAFVNQHLALVRRKPRRVDSRWLGYCVLSRVGQQQMSADLYGGTKDGLGLEDIRSLVTLLPPHDEQRHIAEILDKESRKTDSLVFKIREAIEGLKELRAALISAAVTGKIDVRGEAA